MPDPKGFKLRSTSQTILLGYFSRFWAVSLSFLLTPVYIKLIGIESFAIVGLTFSIQAIFFFLDFGFGTATTLETAQFLAQNKQKELANLFRTGEILFWSFALFLYVFFISSSNLIASLCLSRIPTELFALDSLIPLMGGVVLSQWPILFYNGALLGLQRQDLVNRLNWMIATIKGALILSFLIYFSPTIESFLIANILSGLIHCFGAAFCIRANGLMQDAKFEFRMFSAIAKKSIKLSVWSALNLIIIHIDKVILSRYLDWKLFGYYSVCWILIYGLYGFCGILTTFFGPRFSYLNALKDEKKLIETYHQGCQWMAVITIPPTIVFFFFAREILFFWTRDAMLVEHTYLVASLLITGSCLSALTYIPQHFQIARHWTSLTMFTQIVSLAAWIGFLVVMTPYFGVIAAGVGWVILHLLFLIVYSSLMHRKVLIGEKSRWAIEDIFMPFLGAAAVCSFCWVFLSSYIQGFIGVLLLLFITIATFSASAFMASFIRPVILKVLKQSYIAARTRLSKAE